MQSQYDDEIPPKFQKDCELVHKKRLVGKGSVFGFKMTKKEVIPEFLTEYEIKLITEKQFTSIRLDQVRCIFLFCCYTGLAFADVRKLKRSEIGIGIDGDKWIFTHRQKTDTATRIPLLPAALQILDKFNEHPHATLLLLQLRWAMAFQ
jgi:integrase